MIQQLFRRCYSLPTKKGHPILSYRLEEVPRSLPFFRVPSKEKDYIVGRYLKVWTKYTHIAIYVLYTIE